jgi:S1-C subfamily serine protease
MADGGPGDSAGLRIGDLVLAAGGVEVEDLATLFRRVWSLGPAGAEVPLRIAREGRVMDVTVTSADRNSFLKGPSVH